MMLTHDERDELLKRMDETTTAWRICVEDLMQDNLVRQGSLAMADLLTDKLRRYIKETLA